MSNSLHKNRNMIQRLTVTAILAALVVLLQIISTFLPIGTVHITLSLIPIVLGAVLYGPWIGAFLGLVLGIVVLCIDPTAQSMMFLDGATTVLPMVVTILLCLVKSSLAGFLSGLVAMLLKRSHPKLAVWVAAIVCPTVNSAVFAIFVPIFFYDLITTWVPAGNNVIVYFIFVAVGFNYALELLFNILLSPVVLRVIDVFKAKLAK